MNCNLFTNEAIRSSLKRNSYHELDVSVHFRSNWNLQILVFKKRGNRLEAPGENNGGVTTEMHVNSSKTKTFYGNCNQICSC